MNPFIEKAVINFENSAYEQSLIRMLGPDVKEAQKISMEMY